MKPIKKKREYFSECEDCRRKKEMKDFRALLYACKQFVKYAQNGKHPALASYFQTIAGQRMLAAVEKIERSVRE